MDDDDLICVDCCDRVATAGERCARCAFDHDVRETALKWRKRERSKMRPSDRNARDWREDDRPEFTTNAAGWIIHDWQK